MTTAVIGPPVAHIHNNNNDNDDNVSYYYNSSITFAADRWSHLQHEMMMQPFTVVRLRTWMWDRCEAELSSAQVTSACTKMNIQTLLCPAAACLTLKRRRVCVRLQTSWLLVVDFLRRLMFPRSGPETAEQWIWALGQLNNLFPVSEGTVPITAFFLSANAAFWCAACPSGLKTCRPFLSHTFWLLKPILFLINSLTFRSFFQRWHVWF